MAAIRNDPTLLETVQRIERTSGGRLSIAACDLDYRRSFERHADRKCATASVIKLPILLHTLLMAERGALSLDERVTLEAGDAAPGSGVLKDLSPGVTMSLRDACVLMIVVSDNTATNLVLDRVGIDAVNKTMDELRCPNTRLFRKVFSSGPPINPANARYGLGVTTPRETLRLLRGLYQGRIGSPSLCAEALAILKRQHYRDGLPRFLPESWTFAGKGGAVDHVRNDVGIVCTPGGGAIAIAAFCSALPRSQWTPENPGLIALAEVGRAVAWRFRPDEVEAESS